MTRYTVTTTTGSLRFTRPLTKDELMTWLEMLGGAHISWEFGDFLAEPSTLGAVVNGQPHVFVLEAVDPRWCGVCAHGEHSGCSCPTEIAEHPPGCDQPCCA